MQSTRALVRLRRLRGVAALVVLGFLCRALIPAGFMPAAIGAGGPFAVCHGGLAGEFFLRLEASRSKPAAPDLERHAAHHGHVDHDTLADGPGAEHEAWDDCPFGAAFGAALVYADAGPEHSNLTQVLEASDPQLPVPYRPVVTYRARAPPSSAIQS